MKYFLGLDIGSSSVKAALLDAETGKPAARAHSPAEEMPIRSPRKGFAEQDPDSWWQEVVNAAGLIRQKNPFHPEDVLGIGISYQMHGLVCLDRGGRPVRPAIIWCDSRAVEIGNLAFRELGEEFCLQHYLNSPGNFTASKLKWVREQEPQHFEKIHKVMLPGDYIAYRLTGEMSTTISGLSEAILWDYLSQGLAENLLSYYGIDKRLLPPVQPTFGEQGRLHKESALALGLRAGIPVTYRAGDQPNNAYSLNVLQPGEVAATAGTSGVVYGVHDQARYDPQSRVNSFVHVNHLPEHPRFGVLLCINGSGILNSWLRRQFFADLSYEAINREAAEVPIGSEGLSFYPFGNGAERVLGNRETGAGLRGLQFNRHQRGHIARAAQEGIVFALKYGMEILEEIGMRIRMVRACHANLFLSEVFASSFANASGSVVELFNTDGALGAARASGVGAGWYADFQESFQGMERVRRIDPDQQLAEATADAYRTWRDHLELMT